MGDSVTYYQPRRRVWGTAFIGSLLALLLTRFVLVDSHDTVDIAFSGVAAVGLALVLWEAWRPSVTVADAGVVVRNTFRDHHLTWHEIARAEHRYFPQWYKSGGVHLVLRDGREVRCVAYGDSPLDDMRATQHLLAVLNARTAHPSN